MFHQSSSCFVIQNLSVTVRRSTVSESGSDSACFGDKSKMIS